MMARRKLLVAALAGTIIGGVAYLSTPPALVSAATAPELPDDIDSYLADAERQVTAHYELIPDTEKRVTWYAEPDVRTAYAVVNLHGFSATRQETAPLAERVAAALGANLFETRLAGHGHAERLMHAVRAEQWLADTAEALSIGSRLGEKVVVVNAAGCMTLMATFPPDRHSPERHDRAAPEGSHRWPPNLPWSPHRKARVPDLPSR